MGKRRLSELMGLEIINVHNGEKYGYLGDCEIFFNNETGEIVSIAASEGRGAIFSFKDSRTVEIPWNRKIKQSDRTIIFDYEV
jgi:YlmC/YmxH family sporulation protein